MDRRARRASRAGERAQALLPHHEDRTRRADRRSGAPRPPGPAGAPAPAHRRGGVSRASRILVALAPRKLRDQHGAEMEELFAERLSAARPRGTAAIAAVWLRAMSDLAHA